jgi:redox-sensitive bicupin YhaK (pirin superfamily)
MQHPLYLDVSMKSKSVFTLQIAPNHTAFAYVFEGNGDFGGGQGIRVNSGELALFSEGLHARVASGEHGLRFLLIAGEPLREPVAWRGPIVMNTNEELDIAFREFYEGSFIKNGSF